MALIRRHLLPAITLAALLALTTVFALHERSSFTQLTQHYRRASTQSDSQSYSSDVSMHSDADSRPASSDSRPEEVLTWEQYVQQGQHLDDLTMHSTHVTTQSTWIDYGDLFHHGWNCAPADSEVNHFGFDGAVPIESTLQDLGLSTFFVRPPHEDEMASAHEDPVGGVPAPVPGQNTAWACEHEHDWPMGVPEAPKNKATYARYSIVYNPCEGALITDDIVSPAEAIAEAGSGGGDHRVPPLEAWHDVIFLSMQEMCTDQCAGNDKCDISKLRYIFQTKFESKAMIKIFNHILQPGADDNRGVTNNQQPSMPPRWSIRPHQRITLGSGSAGFHTVIGSPLGSEVAMLLVTHKEQLGSKRIKRITLFREDGHMAGPALLYEIEDLSDVSYGGAAHAHG
ncbi:hypothetical protein LTR86_004876 [Recurvomyces mirabilis]|nr:hypothetical protein LTR86_004876 [Recurvomyces mirabilis]